MATDPDEALTPPGLMRVSPLPITCSGDRDRRQCGGGRGARQGAKGLVLTPGGFSEVAGDQSLENQILDILAGGGRRAVRPSCPGIFHAAVGQSPSAGLGQLPSVANKRNRAVSPDPHLALFLRHHHAAAKACLATGFADCVLQDETNGECVLRWTWTFWGLASMTLLLGALHLRFWGGALEDLTPRREYRFEETLAIRSAPHDYRMRAYIPQDGLSCRIRDEGIETSDLTVEVNSEAAGRRLTLSGRNDDGEQVVRYRASVVSWPVTYELPPLFEWRQLATNDPATLATTPLVQVGAPVLLDTLATLLPIDHPAAAADAARLAERLQERGIGPTEAVDRIFTYCRDRVRPSNFSGKTDAITALKLGESSCGGKSRLFVAMCRTLGIPSRLVGGVILGQGGSKRTSHVWAECRLGDTWVPFDPLNDHYAQRPASYLALYVGDLPLIQHTRGLVFDYAFNSRSEHVPGAWSEVQAADGGASAGGRLLIPLLSTSRFTPVLLVPFALLWTVFCRQVIGLGSMGTFLPVLLGLSLAQAGWAAGTVQLLVIAAIGVALRAFVGRLNLLHVPRNAVMITLIVVATLVLSLVTMLFDLTLELGAVVLPVCSLAMTVERYTVLSLDAGHRTAVVTLAQTLVLALGAGAILVNPFFRSLIVAFPETLFLILAQLVAIGGYRGLRLTELLRFRQVIVNQTRPCAPDANLCAPEEPALRRAA